MTLASSLPSFTLDIGFRVLTDLNIAHIDMRPEGARSIAVALKSSSTLKQLTFSGDDVESEPATVGTEMTEADFSGKRLQYAGAVVLAAFLPSCRYLAGSV
jgi:hypothetical protein